MFHCSGYSGFLDAVVEVVKAGGDVDVDADLDVGAPMVMNTLART
jgi:hypothetical protein